MNLQEFLNQYIGKNVNKNATTHLTVFTGDGGKTFGSFQCVALVQWYIQAVWGLGMQYGNANKFVANLDEKKWEKYIPGEGRTPIVGDIISFNWGIYWHIGIVTSVNPNGFSFLEQNGGGKNSMGMGSWNDIIRIRNKTGYAGVIAWARPKNQNNPLSRKNIASRIFKSLAWGEQKNRKTAWDIWNGQNAGSIATRYEVVTMIKNYFSRIVGKNIDESRIWNSERPNENVSEYELGIMIGRAGSI